MTASTSDAERTGRRIHRLVVAEGGMLAHYGDCSRFVKRDAATGEWTSAALSDAVKAEIRAHRGELKVYAAACRAEMAGWHPSPGSGPLPAGSS